MIENTIFKSGITNRALEIVNSIDGITTKHARSIIGTGEGGRVTVGDAKAFELPFDAGKVDLSTLEAIKPSDDDASKAFETLCFTESFALLESDAKGNVKAKAYAMKLGGVEKGKSPDATQVKEAMGFIVALRELSAERYAADAKSMAEKIKTGIIAPSFATRWTGSPSKGSKVRRQTTMASKSHKADYINSLETPSGAARFTDF
tara:strand:+ start:230 stop:844 length:615 start_codon:yes stop_codon:yes gene_type:complete